MTTAPVMPFSVVLIIILIGIGEIALSTLLQRKLGNPKKAREIQAHMNRVSKELKELIKNKAPKDIVSSKQKEIMPLANASMKLSLKPMIVLFPLFIVIYYVVIGMFLSGWQKYVINFIIPLHYKGFFIAFVLIFGMTVGVIISLYDRKKIKESEKDIK